MSAVTTVVALNKGMSEDTFQSVKSYLVNFGQGKAMYVQFGGQRYIYLQDEQDVVKIRSQFGELIDYARQNI